ncbi:MAG: hypothetical protein J6A01_00115 [Proteobacteria bacterium]|nr:hypothetical protein [Pseudomonadota bacterium]
MITGTTLPSMKYHALIAILLGTLSVAALSCGEDSKKANNNEEECTPYCLSDVMAIICVNGEEEMHSCGGDQKCFEGNCSAVSSETCTNQPPECQGKHSYRLCNGGFWSERIPCEDDQACLNGKCVSEDDVCETGDKKCTEDHKGYVVCAGNGANGQWSSDVFNCAEGTICSDEEDSECVTPKETCTATQPECTPDNKGYRVCVSGTWSDTIPCTGNTSCKNGQCAGEDITSKLPCNDIGQQKCVSSTRVQVCGQDKYWQFTDCPKDIPVCDMEKNECGPAQCTEAQIKCADDETLATCVDNAWDYKKCPDDKPVCKNNACEEAPKECSPGEKKCLSDKQVYKCNDEGHWESENCSGGKVCKDGVCSECENGKTMCADDYHSLKTCKNGQWTTASCPNQTPYCPLNTDSCISVKKWQDCSNTFSFCYNTSLNYCGYMDDTLHGGGEGEGWQGGVIFLSCKSGCIYAKDGIGATCKEFDEYSSCTEIGKTQVAQYHSDDPTFTVTFGEGDKYNLTGMKYPDSTYRFKAFCVMCKVMTDGTARWVPVDKSYCPKN